MGDGKQVKAAKQWAWDSADAMRTKAASLAILRSVDATRAARILDHIADIINQAVAEYDGRK